MLASLLSSELATQTTSSHVLEIYSRICQPFATEVTRRAHENGKHLSLTGPEYHHLSSSERLEETLKQIKENIDWAASVDPSVVLQQAVSLLLAELGT